MVENKNIGFISFEDGTGNVLKIDLPESKRKKYRMLTIVSLVGYLDFEPEKTNNGNDRDYGNQTIVEKHKVMHKYLITNDYYTKSEYLYEVLDVTLKTLINSNGEYASTLTTTKSKGQNKYKLDIESEETRNVSYNELSDGHKNLLNKVKKEIDNSGRAFAVAYKNKALDTIGYFGSMGIIDLISVIIKKELSIPIVALTLTNYSIKHTSASNMRLFLYNLNRKLYGDLTKPIEE